MAGDDQKPNMPIDPLTELAKGAAAMHEYFISLLGAGFGRYEALWLTAAACQGLRPPPGWEKPGTPGG